MSAINWIDYYYEDSLRTVLTYDQTHIKGLQAFGHHLLSSAIPALEDHYHQNCFEFTYLAKGTLSFHVGGKEYRFAGGDIFVTFPDEIHSSGSIPMSINDMYWFQLNIKDEDFLFLGPEWREDLIQGLYAINNRVINTNTKKMREAMETVFKKLALKSPEKRFEAVGIIINFLYEMLEYDKQVSFTFTPDIAKSVDFIFDNICASVELCTLAEISKLSVSRFKQKFKQQLGVTPREFINYHKIEYAKLSLLESKSITDVAMELEFSSSSYFAVVFKRYTLYTPSEYVQRYNLGI